MDSAAQCPEAPACTDLLSAFQMTSATNGWIHVDGVPITRQPVSDVDQARVLQDLAAALYSRWYAQWWPPSLLDQFTPEVPDVIARLRAAHAATPRFDSGWVTRSAGLSGDIIATRDGEDLYLLPPDYVNISRLAAPVQIGDSVAVTRRRDSADPQDGWWFTWGVSGPVPTAPMLRMYWNSGSDAAPALVSGLTAVLEDRALPYIMKCPADSSLFGRCDSVVLYISPATWIAAKAGLRSTYEQIGQYLSPPTPRLTKFLGPGVAIAEDPGDGRSFGESRSRAVAEGLLRALTSGLVNTDDVIATLAERLVAHGISPFRPWLRADSPPDAVSDW